MIKKYLIAVSIVLLGWSIVFGQDTRLKILELPRPDLPKFSGTLDLYATVLLLVEFRADGQIGAVNVISSPPIVTELAAAAAKKIKFVPAQLSGRQMPVFRMVSYRYEPGGWAELGLGENNISLSGARSDPQADAIVARAVQVLGGDRYLQVKSQVGRGKFSVIKEGTVISFQSFVDAIVFPDKERTEFKTSGVKTVQVNTGDTGWVYDGDQDLVKVQNAVQIENFKRGLRTSLDNLLRGYWKGQAELTYVGRRPATLGRRNDVVRLTYKDGFAVEFEFADDGTPQKAIHKMQASEGEEPVTEEDRYALFVEFSGVKVPFVIDRFTNGAQTSRINYDSVELNKNLPDSIFAKPATPKDAKKDVKL